MLESKFQHSSPIECKLREALNYAKDSIMLPANEIGSGIYARLIEEKIIEFYQNHGA